MTRKATLLVLVLLINFAIVIYGIMLMSGNVIDVNPISTNVTFQIVIICLGFFNFGIAFTSLLLMKTNEHK